MEHSVYLSDLHLKMLPEHLILYFQFECLLFIRNIVHIVLITRIVLLLKLFLTVRLFLTLDIFFIIKIVYVFHTGYKKYLLA